MEASSLEVSCDHAEHRHHNTFITIFYVTVVTWPVKPSLYLQQGNVYSVMTSSSLSVVMRHDIMMHREGQIKLGHRCKIFSRKLPLSVEQTIMDGHQLKDAVNVNISFPYQVSLHQPPRKDLPYRQYLAAVSSSSHNWHSYAYSDIRGTGCRIYEFAEVTLSCDWTGGLSEAQVCEPGFQF